MEDTIGVLEDRWVEGLLNLSDIEDTAFKTNPNEEELGPPQRRGWLVILFLSVARNLSNNISPFPFNILWTYLVSTKGSTLYFPF